MTKKEISFIDLVIDMRNAQKNYFKTRSRSALDKSKRLENRVDGYIIDKYISGQLDFFTSTDEVNHTDNLKPCPYCGGENISIDKPDEALPFAKCTYCGATANITVWNSRYFEAKLEGLLQQLIETYSNITVLQKKEFELSRDAEVLLQHLQHLTPIKDEKAQ